MPDKDPEKKRARDAAYRAANRERLRRWHQEYYAQNREKRIASTHAAREKHDPDGLRNAYYARKSRQERRIAVITLLGGKCVRCGFDDWRALQVDHIEGGGTEEMRLLNNHTAYYQRILELGTEKYQLLCANCNQIKRYENGEGVGAGSKKSRKG